MPQARTGFDHAASYRWLTAEGAEISQRRRSGRPWLDAGGARFILSATSLAAQTAAHLVDHVLPPVPVRQWVLTLPFRLRYLVAFDAVLHADVRRILVRAVFRRLRALARRGHRPADPDDGIPPDLPLPFDSPTLSPLDRAWQADGIS